MTPIQSAPADLSVRVTHVDIGTRLISYQEGLDLQRNLHQHVVAGKEAPTLILLEHAATFTAGKRTQPADIPNSDVEVIPTDRGGRVTWHGPGQLVGYPIIPLVHPLDVIAYVRVLEQIMIDTCQQFGIQASRIDGRSGAWCTSPTHAPDRKIGAVGVRVAGGVSMHGFALNVDCDLAWTRAVVPCGISDAGVTSMAQELDREITVGQVIDGLTAIATRHLDTYLAAGQ